MPNLSKNCRNSHGKASIPELSCNYSAVSSGQHDSGRMQSIRHNNQNHFEFEDLEYYHLNNFN